MYKCKNAVNPDFFGDLLLVMTSHIFQEMVMKLNNLLLITNSLACMHFGMKVWKYGMNRQIISKALMIWMTLKGRAANGLDHFVAVKTVF